MGFKVKGKRGWEVREGGRIFIDDTLLEVCVIFKQPIKSTAACTLSSVCDVVNGICCVVSHVV